MGGYCGSPAVVLRNNKRLLGEKIKLKRKDYLGSEKIFTEDHIKASPELLQEIRSRIQKENSKRTRIKIILGVISFLITILLIYFFSTIKWVGINALK